jgi:hypothetical protein
LAVEARGQNLVFAASRTSALPGGCENGGRPSAAAFSAQRQAFQVGDYRFNMCSFLAECRQYLVYVHFASGFTKLPGLISIYTPSLFAVNR